MHCSPARLDLPCGNGAAIGSAYAYRMYTHCGVEWTYFDGRWWKAKPPLSDGSGNPPRGWGNPYDDGWMMLASENHAHFSSASGFGADFEALPGEVQAYPGRLCS